MIGIEKNKGLRMQVKKKEKDGVAAEQLKQVEACRLAANKSLEKVTGETGYSSRLRIFPHILLRENKMIAAAGADRLQEGMRRAFGKATSLAARVKQGQVIMEMNVKREHLQAAKKALKGACVKLPGTPTIIVIDLKK